MPKSLYHPYLRYWYKGTLYSQPNQRGVVNSDAIFSRRWVFIWITKNLTLDTYTVRDRLVTKAATWRKRLNASVSGVTGLYDSNSVLPPGYQAFTGVIYFERKVVTGYYARRYLHFLLQQIGWGGQIFSMEPDTPRSMGGHGPYWRNAGISGVPEGPSAPKGTRVNPFWDVRFMTDPKYPGFRPNKWY